MKIGVITHFGSQDNYGQLLQAFALQKFLHAMGHQPYLIRYNFTISRERLFYCGILKTFLNPRKIASVLKKLYLYRKAALNAKKYGRDFNGFFKQNMSVSPDVYYSWNALRKNPPVADAYITGSDMVWYNLNPAFYLRFGDEKTIRMSYAAGMGFHFPDTEENIACVRKYIADYKFVGVRENQGLTICRKAGRDDVRIVPDPVFLLSQEQYRQMFRIDDVREDGTLLVYLVGNAYDLPLDMINRFAEERGLKILYVGSQNAPSVSGWQPIYPTPEQFLHLVAHCSSFVTNSFHGTAFALIFQKQFVVIPLKKKDDRLATLLRKFNLESRAILDQIPHGAIDFVPVQSMIDSERVEIGKLFGDLLKTS